MKMLPSCQEITEQASDYLDRDQSLWKRTAFRLHLLMCTYCRRHVKHLDLTVSALGRLEEEKDGNGDRVDTQQILDLIRQQQSSEEAEKKGRGGG